MEVADTSTLILANRDSRVGAWLRENEGDVALVDVVAIEYLMGARSAADYAAIELALSGYPTLPTETVDWVRVREVHRALAAQGAGHQRTVRIPDLLIAAVAERNAIAVVHYDEDYDRIAAITGQLTRWVLPRGTLQT
jgi:predicted nucleic acid-binding protein